MKPKYTTLKTPPTQVPGSKQILNTYEITIKGIHCSGCVNLIGMTLEEQGLIDPTVDLKSNTGIFKSDKSIDEVTKLTNNALEEAGEYSLIQIKQN
jgi:hypothetical protein